MNDPVAAKRAELERDYRTEPPVKCPGCNGLYIPGEYAAHKREKHKVAS